MYEVFYNFKAEPFRLSPDHKFCYEHTGYAKARAYMAYAFMRAEGFVMITGRPGTGKTTLVGELVENLASDKVSTANLVCTQLGADDLLKTVAYNFGIAADKVDKAELLQRLSTLFHKWHRDNRRALLVVDEAQDLSLSAMEELRLLTNIQKDGQPLLQIFLLGQPELRDLVLSPEMEQVHQRIVAASHLEGLEESEVEHYVMHRLQKVGWSGDPAISRSVFPLIHKFSEGVPRRINLICSRLLLHGAVEQRHEILAQDLKVVIGELQTEHLAAGTSIASEDFELAAHQEWAQLPEVAVAEKQQPGVRLRAVNDSAAPSEPPSQRKKKGAVDRRPPETRVAEGVDWPRTAVAPNTAAPKDAPVKRAGAKQNGGGVSPFNERQSDNQKQSEAERARSYPVRSAEPPPGDGRGPVAMRRSAPPHAQRGRPKVQGQKSANSQARRPSAVRALVAALLLIALLVAAGIILLPKLQSDSGALGLSRWTDGLSALQPGAPSAPLKVVEDAAPELPASSVEAQSAVSTATAQSVVSAAAVGRSDASPDGDASAESGGDDTSRADQAQLSTVVQPDAVIHGDVASTVSLAEQSAMGDGLAEQVPAESVDVGQDAVSQSAAGEERAPADVAAEVASSVAPIASIDSAIPTATRLDQPLLLLVGFAFDSVRLEEGAIGVLEEAARVLQQQWGSRAEIIGFADQSGDPVYNLELSLDRARSVQEYLVAAGVERQQLDVKGRGASALTASEVDNSLAATDAERNRIVQIKIYPGQQR